MDARDGSIRALVSLPAYDDNLFAGNVSTTAYKALLADEHRPLFPRVWAGQFPSGSTIKPLIAAAALAENVITPNTTVLSVGGIGVGPWFFPDWKAGGHGRVNVRSAIAWSVNTFFYTIGGGYGDFIGLGVDRLTAWMRNFGLGSASGVDLPGEAPGHVPSQEWKQETKGDRWYIGDTYNLSIGQGDLLVTPLQMARITAAIANGGDLVIPHVVMSSSTPDVPRLDADAATFATVRQGMRDTVVYGSGRALSVLPVASAGKTGTAQWNSEKPYHAWYIGYAPAEKPEVVVTVLLEEGGEGSSFAVPVAGDILRAWWNEKTGEHPATSTRP
jgi:penicillin-binding protein 2